MKLLYSLGIIFFIVLPTQNSFEQRQANAAIALTKDKVVYNGIYVSIPYPNDDIPKGQGICTDAIVRAYRN